MANLENKLDENVDGEYYVDDQCISCGLCVAEAPDNFEMEEYAYVYKQPADESEREACESALEACPADAIGNDG